MSDKHDGGRSNEKTVGIGKRAVERVKNIVEAVKRGAAAHGAKALETAGRVVVPGLLAAAAPTAATVAAVKDAESKVASTNRSLSIKNGNETVYNPAEKAQREAKAARDLSDGIEKAGESKGTKRGVPQQPDNRNRDQRRHPNRQPSEPKTWRGHSQEPRRQQPDHEYNRTIRPDKGKGISR